MIWVIIFPKFKQIVAKDLTTDEVSRIQKIKDTMSRDEYAGYSPDEQAKRNEIVQIVGHKAVDFYEV